MMGALTICGFGMCGIFKTLSIDAVPDITNVQVQINTEAPGYSPLESEQRVTFPIETALAGLPQLSHTRSLSAYGLSQVTVVFEEGTDIYFARNLVNSRISVRSRTNCRQTLSPKWAQFPQGLAKYSCTQLAPKHGAVQVKRRAL